MNRERRREQRLITHMPVQLDLAREGFIRNLSSLGMLLDACGTWRVGTPVRLDLHMRNPALHGVAIGRVVRVSATDPRLAAVAFDSLRIFGTG